MKSSSKLALMAAAGILVGGVTMGSAKAADLGGDCCADLEERVAELEATTARKGNRKVSLNISGQINRAIMYFNNGKTSRTFAGLDNHNSSSRFIFSGSAKISSTVAAGFDMMTEWTSGAKTGGVSENAVDGGTSGDSALGVRTANWWLEDKALGRVTVGRLDMQSVVSTIDLGGIGVIGSSSPALIGGKITMGATGAAMERFVHPTIDSNRIEGIRYNSASLAGLTFSGTYGEQDVWGASAKYAAEFSGFQVAAGVGYHETKGKIVDGGLDTSTPREKNAWGGSLAMKHVATGIFVQGMFTESKYDKNVTTGSKDGVAVNPKQNATAKFWEVQAGVAKNWFGLGNTALYGEYGEGTKYAMAFDAAVTDSKAKFYGLGMVQNIDAAAMELYLGWRHMDADLSKGAVKTKGDLDTVVGGARIKF